MDKILIVEDDPAIAEIEREKEAKGLPQGSFWRVCQLLPFNGLLPKPLHYGAAGCRPLRTQRIFSGFYTIDRSGPVRGHFLLSLTSGAMAAIMGDVCYVVRICRAVGRGAGCGIQCARRKGKCRSGGLGR